MRMLRSIVPVLAILALGLAASPVWSQSQTPSGSTTSTASTSSGLTTERLFLSFIEDAAIADRQWWEGQVEFLDGDPIDAIGVRGVVALQPWKDVEIGGRIGFGDTDTPAGLDDGRGATDADIWGKYVIGRDDRGADYSVGGVVTVPTGDDSSGLGYDAFGVEAFAAARVPLKRVTVGGHIGVRFNEDGQILGVELDGQTSALLGGMVVAPLTTDLNVVGELVYESERFDGLDADARLLGGINWRVFRRGTVRGAVGFGLADGAPDAQFLVGYAAEF